VNIPKIWKRASKVAVDNAPTILTAIGVTGAITTAILTGKASFKASEIINREQARHDLEEQSHPFTPKEKFLLVWPQYIPAAATAAMTVAAIVCSNRISTKRAAALASAYTVSQEVLERYKDKVAKVLGEAEAKKVHDEVAKDVAAKNPPPATVLIGGGEHVCWVYDDYTDRWFKSSHMDLERAVIDINLQLANEGTATLADFYRILGVTHAAIYDEVGWTHEKKLEVEIGSTKMDDNTLAYTLNFRTVPVRGY
jgi:hypothetical protein